MEALKGIDADTTTASSAVLPTQFIPPFYSPDDRVNMVGQQTQPVASHSLHARTGSHCHAAHSLLTPNRVALLLPVALSFNHKRDSLRVAFFWISVGEHACTLLAMWWP
jgi:hypothetical protein